MQQFEINDYVQAPNIHIGRVQDIVEMRGREFYIISEQRKETWKGELKHYIPTVENSLAKIFDAADVDRLLKIKGKNFDYTRVPTDCDRRFKKIKTMLNSIDVEDRLHAALILLKLKKAKQSRAAEQSMIKEFIPILCSQVAFVKSGMDEEDVEEILTENAIDIDLEKI